MKSFDSESSATSSTTAVLIYSFVDAAETFLVAFPISTLLARAAKLSVQKVSSLL